MLVAALLSLFQSGPVEPPPAAAAPGAAPRAEGPEAKKRQRPDSINGVQFVVNDQAVTKYDFIKDLRRTNKPYSTPQELERALQETFADRVRLLLMEQGGRELGFDEAVIKRYIDDSIKENIQEFGGIVDLSAELRRQHLDPQELRETKRRAAYRELWGLAIDGRQPGASGRVSVDRYVRPGRLLFEYERTPRSEIVNATVDFQSLIISVELSGTAAAARQRAEELVERARAGENFTQLIRDHSHSSNKARDGWERKVPLRAIATGYPDLADFVDGAAAGDVSDPIPERVDGELVAFRIVSSTARMESEVDFMSASAQEELRGRLLGNLSRYRRERELSRMLEAAYVWPQELFSPPGDR